MRITTTALITALTSMGATFAAVLLYLTTTQMQAFGVDAIVMAILFGYGLALYGCLEMSRQGHTFASSPLRIICSQVSVSE